MAVARNLLLALCAVLVFHVVTTASGRVSEGGGLGWDGRVYARMIQGSMIEGSPNARSRPLLVLATRVPYFLGVDIIASFQLLNYLYAFALYLVVCLILDRYSASSVVKLVVVSNLALSIAVSKMYAFYPTQIDLGAIALTTLAFHFASTDRRFPAGIACVLAAASREFGVIAALYGAHRWMRQRRPWWEVTLVFAPGVATTVLIRWWVLTSAPHLSASGLTDAFRNIQATWSSPVFATAFVYCAIVLFGGITVLLALRPVWCLKRLRHEPELATFLILVVGLSAVGSLDVWRYLVFALPVVVVLIAQYFQDLGSRLTGRLLAAMTVVTVLTQRPFERMDDVLYMRDWFPLYRHFDGGLSDDVARLWMLRVALLVLIMVVLVVALRLRLQPRQADAA